MLRKSYSTELTRHGVSSWLHVRAREGAWRIGSSPDGWFANELLLNISAYQYWAAVFAKPTVWYAENEDDIPETVPFTRPREARGTKPFILRPSQKDVSDSTVHICIQLNIDDLLTYIPWRRRPRGEPKCTENRIGKDHGGSDYEHLTMDHATPYD